MTIHLTIPLPVVFALATVLSLLLWHAVGDMLLGRFLWQRLARRDGNILMHSRWFWFYAIPAGPLAWVSMAKSWKEIRKSRQQNISRRRDPQVVAKLREAARAA